MMNTPSWTNIRWVGLVLCCCLLSCAKEQRVNPSLFQTLSLPTLSSGEWHAHTCDKDSASVFVFMLPDCPIAQKYTLELERLRQDFEGAGISFYGVFSGKTADKEKALSFKEKYKVGFPFLKDENNDLKQMFAAEISPEVFIINPQKRILYRGAIDNWFYALGKKRQVVSEHYLQDALDAISKGEEVETPTTQAVGCYLPD